MIRVVIADDHHLVMRGIRALLEQASDIQVIGEAGDGHKAVELAEQLKPDVLILDISMPRLNGILAVEHITALGLATRVVMLSMYPDEMLVRQALKKGAKGYLLKRSVPEELLLAVRAAQRGETYLSPEIASSMMESFLSPVASTDSDPYDQLSLREREVLQLVAEGHTSNQIAGILSLSVKTIEKHRANVMSKLGVRDMAGLMRTAIRYGLVRPD
jgi:DNA-binding NarL/FixJ family response regulator